MAIFRLLKRYLEMPEEKYAVDNNDMVRPFCEETWYSAYDEWCKEEEYFPKPKNSVLIKLMSIYKAAGRRSLQRVKRVP